jgi:hypothetical protein
MRKKKEQRIKNILKFIYLSNITALPITRRPEQQYRLKRLRQRFSKLHLSFFASAVCNNVN